MSESTTKRKIYVNFFIPLCKSMNPARFDWPRIMKCGVVTLIIAGRLQNRTDLQTKNEPCKTERSIRRIDKSTGIPHLFTLKRKIEFLLNQHTFGASKHNVSPSVWNSYRRRTMVTDRTIGNTGPWSGGDCSSRMCARTWTHWIPTCVFSLFPPATRLCTYLEI